MKSISVGYLFALFTAAVRTVVADPRVEVPVFGYSGSDGGIIQLHPDSQSVTLNSTVRLQCRVRILTDPQTGAGAQIYWSKNDFGIGGSREDIQEYGRSPRYPYSRYDLPYNVKEGQYDLQITNVELSDEGSYVCQVNFMKQQYLSQTAVLTVQVPSEAPKLIQVTKEGRGPAIEVGSSTPVTVDDGTIMVLKCVARHGKPGAHLSWSIDGVPVQSEPDSTGKFNVFRAGFTGNLTNQITSSVSFPRLKDSSSEMSARLNKLHHGKLIECRATNAGYGEHALRPAFTKLEVRYAPVVSIQIRPPRKDNEYMEHDIITVECTAHGRPDTFVWEWFVNGGQVENIADSWYRLRLTRNMHNAVFQCVAISDKKGHSEITVRVKFGPQFLEPSPLLFTASPGEDVAMDCPARGNPTPRIDWRRESSQEVLHRGPTYRRNNLREDDFGTYTCTAFVNEFPPVSKQMFIARRKPPSIQPNPIVHARLGRSARLRCTVNSVPMPPEDQKHWFFNGRPVRSDAQRSFEREEFIGGVVLILQIAHVMITDYGKYNCTVQNGYGTDWKLIDLRRQEDVPLQFIVGTSAAIGLLIIAGLIFLCVCRQRLCEKKYKKGRPIQPQNNLPNSKRTGMVASNYKAPEKDFRSSSSVQDGIYQSTFHPWLPNNSQNHLSYVKCGSDMEDQRSGQNIQKISTSQCFFDDYKGTQAFPVDFTTAYCPTISSCQLMRPFCNGGNYVSNVDPRLLNSTQSAYLASCPTIISNMSGSHPHEFLSDPISGQYEGTGINCVYTTDTGQLVTAIPQITTLDLTSGIPTQFVAHNMYSSDALSGRSSLDGLQRFSPKGNKDTQELLPSPVPSGSDSHQQRRSSMAMDSSSMSMPTEMTGLAYVLDEHTTNV